MPSALVPLANLTLSGSQASVTFSSISGSYRDLLLVITPIAVASSNWINFRFNSDSGANYSYTLMAGNGSSASAYSQTTSYINSGVLTYMDTANPNSISMHILDYQATDKHKSTLIRNGAAATGTEANAGRWASTSAITTIRIGESSGSGFAAGSTFALYGVSA